jgi:hypothetical protein
MRAGLLRRNAMTQNHVLLAKKRISSAYGKRQSRNSMSRVIPSNFTFFRSNLTLYIVATRFRPRF